MKSLRILPLLFLFMSHFGNKAYAQMEESRTKIELTIRSGGKTIVAELTSLSTSINRGYEEPVSPAGAKDSVKKKEDPYKTASAYLNMEVRRINDDLLRLFGNKQNRFDGTITIVDTYGKVPTRTFKFTQAMLSSYSEQNASASMGESYGSGYFSITCSNLTINGITIE